MRTPRPASGPSAGVWICAAFAAALALAGPGTERALYPAAAPAAGQSLPINLRARSSFAVLVARPAGPAPRAGKAAPGKAGPGKAAPGKAAPGKAAPGKAAPGKAAPGKAAPATWRRVAAGEILLPAGTAATRADLPVLRAAFRAAELESNADFAARSLLGLAVILVLLLGVRRFVVREPAPGRRFGLVLVLAGIGPLLVAGVALFAPAPVVAAPAAVGVLLAGVIAGRRVALAVWLATVFLVGLGGFAPRPALIALAGGAAVMALVGTHRRTLGVLGVAALGALAQALLCLLLEPESLRHTAVPLTGPVGGAALAAVGALAAGVLATALSWPALWFLRMSTAGRLRRLASPAHPLQQELRERAPGTYQHSRNVAHLVDATAASIGGDRLLLRAGACYHDLGKIERPEMWHENLESPEDDPHLSLDPEESAEAIAKHVVDGIRIAKEHRLPGEVLSLIASHHGTGPVQAPLRRARREGRDIDPALYYYPGPLPHSLEAALLMLADAVEAESREIDDPTLSAVSAVVERVMERKMREFQFEECEVTQAELVAAQEAMVLALRHALHRRLPLDSGV